MTRLLLFTFTLLGLLCLSVRADNNQTTVAPVLFPWGEFKSEAGVRFTIRDVEIGKWIKDADSHESLGIIAISYELVNETENRKIDLSNELAFTLTDEFGNQYKQFEKPLDYPRPVTVLNKYFPSFYPEEIFSSTVFFEAPVKSSQVIDLLIDAQNLGVTRQILFHLPVVRAFPPVKEQTAVVTDDDLQLILPPKLKSVKPGDTIPIRVRFAKDFPPDKILVITPFYIYEDPRAAGQYNLRIPKKQPAGPLTIIVLASWAAGDTEQTASKSFTVLVRSRQKAVIENYPMKTTENY